jgi:DNA-binding response OmpR family regulator
MAPRADARLVVVAEHDGWILRLLQDGLREHGVVVIATSTAESALSQVTALKPDCVVCDAALPDHDGFWLASRVRAEPLPVSVTPLLMLASEGDERARMKAFEAGADAYMTKPFRVDEVVAQLNALVVLAQRMKGQRTALSDSLGPPSSLEAASFDGDLEQMTLPSLLAILEMERRTGRVSVRSNKSRVVLELQGGFVVEATLDGKKIDPVDALRPAIAWSTGRVTFRAAVHRSSPPAARPIRVLIGAARPSGMMAAVVPTSIAPPARPARAPGPISPAPATAFAPAPAPAHSPAAPSPPPAHSPSREPSAPGAPQTKPSANTPRTARKPALSTKLRAVAVPPAPPPPPPPAPPLSPSPKPKSPALGDQPTRRMSGDEDDDE